MDFKKLFTSLAPLKKVATKPSALPSFVKSVTARKETELSREDLQVANIDLLGFRNEGATNKVINKLAKVSPDLSAAINSASRLAITPSYTVIARNWDGIIDPDATRYVQTLTQRFDAIDATEGFSSSSTIRAYSESFVLELMKYGSCACELVLDKGYLPSRLQPISTTQVVFKQKAGSSSYKPTPYQKVSGGDDVLLDTPAFFYCELDNDMLQAYSDSPLQSAVQPILASQDFINDLRRVTKKAMHPRVLVEIDTEKWLQTVPPEIQYDKKKVVEAMNQTVADISTVINEANPEDAWVFFDTATPTYLDHGNSSIGDEYKALNSILNGKLSAGSKSSPTVLGHDATGSSNIASTQSMLHVKNVEGAIQLKLNELYSRVFTLAARLAGLDVTVEFKYQSIDLRPESELEAFRTMKKDRILHLLSLGFYSDEEASIMLTGTLPEVGAPKLSGTMFHGGGGGSLIENPLSNNAGTGKPPNSAQNETLSPKTPKETKNA